MALVRPLPALQEQDSPLAPKRPQLRTGLIQDRRWTSVSTLHLRLLLGRAVQYGPLWARPGGDLGESGLSARLPMSPNGLGLHRVVLARCRILYTVFLLLCIKAFSVKTVFVALCRQVDSI